MAVGYLVGAIPFSWLIGRWRGVDIRTVGSGNVGATNLGRACGRAWGLTGFALDVVKGLGPTLAAGWVMGWAGVGVAVEGGEAGDGLSSAEAWKWLAVAASAMLGHVFPVYLGFRGGKGVATGFGVTLGVWPYLTLPAIGALLTWVLFAGALRYVGLASVAAASSIPCFAAAGKYWMGWDWGAVWPFVAAGGAMAMLVVYRHRGNLARIARGTEPRLGERG